MDRVTSRIWRSASLFGRPKVMGKSKAKAQAVASVLYALGFLEQFVEFIDLLLGDENR